MGTEYGLLLPHFGPETDRGRIIEGSRRAEQLDFDSVWVRDHVVFHPHGMEGTDNTFIDPFVVLAALSSATTKIKLGFGSLIVHRHPILLAMMLNSLAYMAGDRLLLSLGLGTFQQEFDAIGVGEWPRDEVIREQVAILRKLCNGEHASWDGKFYHFHHVGLKPEYPSKLQIFYAGATPASVRRALEYCDGWLPGRITLATYRKRTEKLRSGAAAQGRPRLIEGCIPITSIDDSRKSAIEKVNLNGLLDNANKQKFWVKPASGSFKTAEDLEGSFIAGSPDDIVAQVQKFLEIGIDHVVFDLRFRFESWEKSIELLGKEVVPRLRKIQSTAGSVR